MLIKYLPGDAMFPVTFKPKICYASNVTNWANDLYTRVYISRTIHAQGSFLSQGSPLSSEKSVSI